MAELADAHGSGPCSRNTVRVRVPFSAVYENIINRAPTKVEALFLYIL